ncbi:hypothetical protein RN22_10200 [Grimontia sp. AD028]|uniref:pirin family protein n=1 Tax=Grimontia sp. AD028 TaxID=1581149 RepID=UPI00061B5A11|nr:pirin family protein [Grimontia sp. AD028]KKD60548.1 hypothetical protein RN22_10200 [Grimontia sp. AD028]
MINAVMTGRRHGPIHGFIDSSNMGALNPFCLFDHFSLQSDRKQAGFDFHGHSGIGVITYITGADLKHEDSTGETRMLEKGSAQLLIAGGGAIHKETLLSENGSFEGFQLWTILPTDREMEAPSYQFANNSNVPVVRSGSTATKVIVGEYQDVKSPLQHIIDLSYFHVSMDGEGSEWTHRFSGKEKSRFIYVIKGRVGAGERSVGTRQLIKLDIELNDMVLSAMEADTEFLVFSGEQLAQNMVSTGPSVHSNSDNARQGTQRIQQLLQQRREEVK